MLEREEVVSSVLVYATSIYFNCQKFCRRFANGIAASRLLILLLLIIIAILGQKSGTIVGGFM